MQTEAAELFVEIEALTGEVEALRDKLCGVETCGCSYDKSEDVCACHSPKLRKAEAEIGELNKQVADLNNELGCVRRGEWA